MCPWLHLYWDDCQVRHGHSPDEPLINGHLVFRLIFKLDMSHCVHNGLLHISNESLG